jgi:xanthine dehydrogenase small subunit
MIDFILNDKDISTDLPAGMTVLDFVRYRQNLKGTKIGCREGDCGACTILVGELVDGLVNYRTMTSCLMPLANAAGKHIVTVEGINPSDGELTPVQQAIVDESGTQCGFCTVGFVMSLTGYCIDETDKTREMALSSVDGNICRCTGYKSIERAAANVRQIIERRQRDRQVSSPTETGESNPRGIEDYLKVALARKIVPEYFSNISNRLSALIPNDPQSTIRNPRSFVSGGTDVYVQKPDAVADSDSAHLFYDEELRGIRDAGEYIEIGASATVTDLLVSPVMRSIFPDLYKHLKLVSSTPIRNMATLAGNFVNASPIGDMTVWFLALDGEIILEPAGGNTTMRDREEDIHATTIDELRRIALKDLYLGYKQLAKTDDEIIKSIRFRKPGDGFRFNFEKVCKRTYLDIATVNTAIWIKVSSPLPGATVVPELLRGKLNKDPLLGKEEHDPSQNDLSDVVYRIEEAHVAAGGVAPIPLYLKETSRFLTGREVNAETVAEACEIIQTEISPISDVRGTAEYKRLLLRQLFKAHFIELFGVHTV